VAACRVEDIDANLGQIVDEINYVTAYMTEDLGFSLGLDESEDFLVKGFKSVL